MAIELTKELLADLKISRAIVLRFEQDNKHSTMDVFTGNHGDANERRVTYPLPVSQYFKLYGTWHTFSYPRQCTPLTTFIDSLKPGDFLDFRIEDYANQYVEEAGMVHEVLTCHVTRYRKNSERAVFDREFFIDSHVVPAAQRNMFKAAE